jgi:hypothetical protein
MTASAIASAIPSGTPTLTPMLLSLLDAGAGESDGANGIVDEDGDEDGSANAIRALEEDVEDVAIEADVATPWAETIAVETMFICAMV